MDSTPGLEIEVAAYNEFFGRWNQGMFEKQRLAPRKASLEPFFDSAEGCTCQ